LKDSENETDHFYFVFTLLGAGWGSNCCFINDNRDADEEEEEKKFITAVIDLFVPSVMQPSVDFGARLSVSQLS